MSGLAYISLSMRFGGLIGSVAAGTRAVVVLPDGGGV